ncbi:MAG TPA: DUF6232 family protein [Ignavibacteria bacterium]|nr:DUF6232 family protein [Ignavibacteria bacterium]
MTEYIYYQKDNVTITSSRIIVNQIIYLIRNISSVSYGVNTKHKEKNTIYKLLLFGIGLMVMSIGAPMVGKTVESASWVIIGTVIFLSGFLIKEKKQEIVTHYITIDTNSGSKNIFSSSDKYTVDKIIEAINQAIIN